VGALVPSRTAAFRCRGVGLAGRLLPAGRLPAAAGLVLVQHDAGRTVGDRQESRRLPGGYGLPLPLGLAVGRNGPRIRVVPPEGPLHDLQGPVEPAAGLGRVPRRGGGPPQAVEAVGRLAMTRPEPLLTDGQGLLEELAGLG